jgi:hypothetical protein
VVTKIQKIQKFKTKYKKGKTLFGDTGSCSGPIMGSKVFSLKTDSLPSILTHSQSITIIQHVNNQFKQANGDQAVRTR